MAPFRRGWWPGKRSSRAVEDGGWRAEDEMALVDWHWDVVGRRIRSERAAFHGKDGRQMAEPRRNGAEPPQPAWLPTASRIWAE